VKILSYKPGHHDGAISYLNDDQLVSIEAENEDSGVRSQHSWKVENRT
jgi:hypothetical protein